MLPRPAEAQPPEGGRPRRQTLGRSRRRPPGLRSLYHLRCAGTWHRGDVSNLVEDCQSWAEWYVLFLQRQHAWRAAGTASLDWSTARESLYYVARVFGSCFTLSGAGHATNFMRLRHTLRHELFQLAGVSLLLRIRQGVGVSNMFPLSGESGLIAGAFLPGSFSKRRFGNRPFPANARSGFVSCSRGACFKLPCAQVDLGSKGAALRNQTRNRLRIEREARPSACMSPL